MPRRLVCGLFAAAMMMWGATRVTAQNAEADYSRPGPYVGLGFSYGKESFDVDDAEHDLSNEISQIPEAKGCDPTKGLCELHVLIDRTDSLGGDFRAGYRFNTWSAAEVNFQYYDNYDLKLGGAAADFADIRMFNFFVNGKFFPLEGPLQPYLSAGIGGVYAEVDTDARTISRRIPISSAETVVGTAHVNKGSDSRPVFAGRIGGGLDYYLTRSLLVNLDISYTMTTGYDVEGLDNTIQLNYVPITLGLQYRLN